MNFTPYGQSRREFLSQAGNGFFGTAMAYMLASDGTLRAAPTTNPVPTLPAKAKACIFLFMVGGPSHIDTFDPKPALVRLHGTKHDFPAHGPIAARSGVLPLLAARPVGHRSFRTVPAFGRLCR